MIRLCYLIMFIIGSIAPVYAMEPLPIDDPDALRAAIEKGGKGSQNEVMKRLAPNGIENDDFSKLMVHIETGDEKWLKVADALRCCVDGITSESLNWAMGDAFTHSPEAVLRRSWIDVGWICSGLDSETKTLTDARVQTVKAALERVKDPALQKKKVQCSKSINEVH